MSVLPKMCEQKTTCMRNENAPSFFRFVIASTSLAIQTRPLHVVVPGVSHVGTAIRGISTVRLPMWVRGVGLH